MIEKIIFILLCGVANCARGRKLFGLTDSTTIGRIVSMLAIALMTGALTGSLYVILWTFVALMLWASLPWMKYLSAAIGSAIDINQKAVAPIDWIMSKIPLDTTHKEDGTLNIQLRLWGLIAMGLRMTLLAPCIIGVAYLAGHSEQAWLILFTPLLGAIYFVCGFPQVYRFFPAGAGVEISECFVGAGIGTLICYSALRL